MGYIAQRPARLSGHQYEPGDPVPAEVVGEGLGEPSLVRLGIIAVVPDAAVAGVRAGEGAATEAFDPGQHKADDVLAYLDANPDQLERVHEAESAGENRKGLMAELDRRLEAATAPARDDDTPDDGPPG